MEIYFTFLSMYEYTGRPNNIITIPPQARSVLVNNWLPSTNNPLIIAIIGVIGYRGTL